MFNNGINTNMCWWFFVIIMSIDSTRSQNTTFGENFLTDAFLELSGGGGVTALPKQKSCVSNRALISSIIGTLILSTLIGFLAWLIYVRPKFTEFYSKHLHVNEKTTHVQKQHHQMISSSSSMPNDKQSTRRHRRDDDYCVNQLPLEVATSKFGTFPFRHSQTSSMNGHYNRTDWMNRISSSFRSVNMDQDFEMVDVKLLDPTFTGLNFSITGNMRAGIFVKEILDKGLSQVPIKSSPTDQLKPGDRIMALTVCFESIVYEDALTILSYASPYPVILRIQRPSNHTKVDVITENRPTAAIDTISNGKWRDDFDHYDNDTPVNRSFIQSQPPQLPNPLPMISTDTKASSTPQNRSSPKKTRPNASTQPRTKNKSFTTNKGNKLKTLSNSVLAAAGATTKRCSNDMKKHRSKIHDQRRMLTNQMMLMSTGLTAKPTIKLATPSINRKPMKTVTDAEINYLYQKSPGNGRAHMTDTIGNFEETLTPYYDSPYDYCHSSHVSQYQHLPQTQINKNNNNNNSLMTESLTAVTRQ